METRKEVQQETKAPLQIVKLEERIVPGVYLNHNETMVEDDKTSPPLQIVKLEERIAPGIYLNHNETMVRDAKAPLQIVALEERLHQGSSPSTTRRWCEIANTA